MPELWLSLFLGAVLLGWFLYLLFRVHTGVETPNATQGWWCCSCWQRFEVDKTFRCPYCGSDSVAPL